MKALFFIFGLCILLITGMAYSSSHKMTEKPDYSGHFGDMDTNMDEGVDWEEFKAYFLHAESKIFKKTDVNSDQKIDHDEWHEFKDLHGYGHKE
jgi:hypothetical protein